MFSVLNVVLCSPYCIQICREQFVALHSEPILEDLANYLEDKFGGMMLVICAHNRVVVVRIV